AIAGPLASVIIAGLAYGLSIFGSAVEILNQTKYIPIFQILGWVYSINLYIAIFNLIPAFPMDGGRILRAGLWHLAKDKSGATRVSAYLALWIGILGLISPIFFGLQMFFIALIGFFIIQTALGTLMQLKIKANLKTLEKPEQNQNNESAKSENKTDENKNK
ncbi:MAG: site-2 protease family protein, partial [Patescibacteria group bacterium]